MSRVSRLASRISEPAVADPLARWSIAAALLAYLALALWLTRGAGFTLDELTYFGESGSFAPGQILAPFAGHLTAITRLFYESSLQLFGTEHLPFQLATILSHAVAAGLLFLLLRRWVGPLAALAAAIVVLFAGSVPSSLQGNAMMWAHSTAFGLGAMLAFDRGTRRGDLLATAALLGAVLSLEVGIAFALAVAAWALAEEGGVSRRLWVAAVPLAAYLAWWLWALQFEQGITTFSNVLLVPNYSAEAFAAAAAAFSGLGVDFGQIELPRVELGWGRPALIAVLALTALGVHRHGSGPRLIAAAVLLAALGIAGALAFGPLRTPDSARYVYPAGVGLLLLMAAAFRGSRPGPRATVALLVVVAVALPANLWLLRERGEFVRSLSTLTEVRLASIELQRGSVPADFKIPIQFPVEAGSYLEATDRLGALGMSPEALESQEPALRSLADKTLGEIVSPRLGPAPGTARCGGAGARPELQLPPGGGVVRSPGGGTLRLRRFGDAPVVEVGALEPGLPRSIVLPQDRSPRPWLASVAGSRTELC